MLPPIFGKLQQKTLQSFWWARYKSQITLSSCDGTFHPCSAWLTGNCSQHYFGSQQFWSLLLQIQDILPGHLFCVALSGEVPVGLVTKRDCHLRFIIQALSGPFLGSRRVALLYMYCSLLATVFQPTNLIFFCCIKWPSVFFFQTPVPVPLLESSHA